MPTHPPKLAVDAKGYVWRVYPDAWSMAPQNPDNSPVPEPVTYYLPVPTPTGRKGSGFMERVCALREQYEELLRQAHTHFQEGKESLAAGQSERAAKIAGELSETDRRLGNLCSDHRLLEWGRK